MVELNSNIPIQTASASSIYAAQRKQNNVEVDVDKAASLFSNAMHNYEQKDVADGLLQLIKNNNNKPEILSQVYGKIKEGSNDPSKPDNFIKNIKLLSEFKLFGNSNRLTSEELSKFDNLVNKNNTESTEQNYSSVEEGEQDTSDILKSFKSSENAAGRSEPIKSFGKLRGPILFASTAKILGAFAEKGTISGEDIIQESEAGVLQGTADWTMEKLAEGSKFGAKILGGATTGVFAFYASAKQYGEMAMKSKNPYVQLDAGINIARDTGKGVVEGAIVTAATVESGGLGLVGGTVLATGADYVMTKSGDAISKATGYEDKFKVKVMSYFFETICRRSDKEDSGIKFTAGTPKSTDSHFDETYFAKMAFIMENNPTLIQALKNSGIKEIKMDDINDLSGNLLAKVINEAKGTGKVTVEISKGKEQTYSDADKSSGKITQYTITMRDESGKAVKTLGHTLVQETYHNPLWHSVEETTQSFKSNNVSFKTDTRSDVYGVTPERLNFMGKKLSTEGVTKFTLNGISTINDPLASAVEAVAGRGDSNVKEVAVKKGEGNNFEISVNNITYNVSVRQDGFTIQSDSTGHKY